MLRLLSTLQALLVRWHNRAALLLADTLLMHALPCAAC